jgi:hypothetical protein
MTAVSDPGTPVSAAAACEVRLERPVDLGAWRRSLLLEAEQLVFEHDSQR